METNNEVSEIAQESEVIGNSNLEDTMLDNSSSSIHQKPTQNSEQNPKKASAGNNKKPDPKFILSSPQSFDSRIDNLVEFKETILPTEVSDMCIAQELYKLKTSKDIPSIKLIKYDGDPLGYVEFIECFKLLIHDKPHFSDDIKMAQFKMHVTGKAKRTISGLGSHDKIYVTALTTIKEQSGQPNGIATGYITKLIDNISQRFKTVMDSRYNNYPLM